MSTAKEPYIIGKRFYYCDMIYRSFVVTCASVKVNHKHFIEVLGRNFVETLIGVACLNLY